MLRNGACAVSGFVKANVVLVIAATLAVISCFIVKPDSQYIGYFDFKTLTCLFCTLAVICALKNIRFFTITAKKIVKCAGNTRTLSLALVYITFIGSMFLANDMALLTFLPLGYISLSETGKQRFMAPIFILQNIAANLGGMLTPFGNPQNLYIYTKFNIPTGEFMAIMVIPFAVSMALFTVCCLFIPKEALELCGAQNESFDRKRSVFYLVLFALTILTVFRIVPYYVCLPIILVAVLFADRSALGKVDYPLLLTFVCFFLLAGNVSRIPAVSQFFSSMLDQSTLLTAIGSCQVISNVPSAILLSEFTTNYKELLLGVNIGGVGTLISSLASLITFREYTSHVKGKTLSYLLMFTAINFGFLIILTLLALLII
ncbi:MAG: citrate transporter [Ruminococcaceae bacterium]|nr:citrate transporter [Oscillospiraceae bacterium]